MKIVMKTRSFSTLLYNMQSFFFPSKQKKGAPRLEAVPGGALCIKWGGLNAKNRLQGQNSQQGASQGPTE